MDLVGLTGEGFLSKSFRLTGATAVVEGEVMPDSVRAVGRWCNRPCFQEHYVHARLVKKMTDTILLS